MERLPDKTIGEILSRISDAREVVVASTTCKKWRRAMQFHLKSLTFSFSGRDGLDVHTIGTAITRTILQTKRLESLTIILNRCGLVFPAS